MFAKRRTPPVQRKGVSIERLRSFLAVIDAGSIADAAPGDPVRQSQLSRQMSELEAALGCELFARAGRSRVATDAGRALAAVARELESGLDRVASSATRRAAHCTLGAGDSVLRWLVLPSAAALDVSLTVQTLSADDVNARVLDGRVDVGVVRSVAAHESLSSIRIGTVTYAVFEPRARRAKPRPLAVPTGEPGLSDALDDVGEPALRCETFPQVAAAVASGGYAGVLPTLARHELPRGAFSAKRHAALDRCASPLLLVWRKRLDDVRPELVPVRRRLASLLTQRLGGGR